jgi:Transcriptional regulatory protein, C terminal
MDTSSWVTVLDNAQHAKFCNPWKRSDMAYNDPVNLQYLESRDRLQQMQKPSVGHDLNVKNAPFPPATREIASLIILDDDLEALRDVLESESYQVALVPRDEWIKWGHIRRSTTESVSGTAPAVLLPFSWNQLVARVCDFFCSTGALPERRVARFEDFRVDFTRMEVRRSSGEAIRLTAQEFKTLKCFLLNPDQVLSRDELLNEAWGYQRYPSTRTVDNHVFKLRQKFERDPTHPVHFLTVHAIGYKFVP